LLGSARPHLCGNIPSEGVAIVQGTLQQNLQEAQIGCTTAWQLLRKLLAVCRCASRWLSTLECQHIGDGAYDGAAKRGRACELWFEEG
jgi:hypothetical protein